MDQYTNPKTWGPHFWFMFRCIANNYSEPPTPDDIQYTKTFFYSFQFILPCIKCKESYILHYGKHNIDNYLENKDKLIQWVELIYKETNDNIIKETIEKQINTRTPIPQTSTRVCNSCGNKSVPSESAFPQSNENNSGPNKGSVGALRKILASSDVQTKYILIAFYNWIKYPFRLPNINEAQNIMKGYILLKNSNPEGFYPIFFMINDKKIYMEEENISIFTNPEIGNLLHDKLKVLSI